MVFLLLTCQELPDDLQRTNPLDVYNPATHGDPFHLRARIAQGGVLLEWDATAMGGIQSYVVYRQMNEAGPYVQRVAVPVSQTSYVDTVSNGHTYRWRVVALGPGGESSLSNVVSVKITMDPLVVIAGGAEYTPTREVEVTVIAGTAVRMKLFTDTTVIYMPWVPFQASSQVTLPEGAGEKHVYVMVQYPDSMVSAVVSDVILPHPIDLLAFSILPADSQYVNHATVILTVSSVGATEMKLALTPDSSAVTWQAVTPTVQINLGGGDGLKRVYAWFRNDWFESGPVVDSVGLDRTVASDSIWWTASREDSVLLVGDTVEVWLQMEPDAFGPESGGHGVASMPQGVQSIALTDLGSGLYRGVHRVAVADSAAHGQVTAMFWDRAGNVLGPLQATRALDVCWLEIVGSTDTLALNSANRVAVQGSYAYVADVIGLKVVDISNPLNPQIAGSCGTPGGAFDVAVQGSYACIAAGLSGLHVVDISNPSTPQIVGSRDTPRMVYCVAVQGFHACIVDTSSGLQVVDISTPSNPQIVGSCCTSVIAFSVAIQGSCAYVAVVGSGLLVVDISTPSNPQIVGSCSTPGDAYGVAVQGSYAYVADGGSGLQVVDISTPSNPQIVGSRDTPYYAHGVAVQGSYAYVADGASGLQVVDISNPSNPHIVGSRDTPGYAGCVAVQGSYAYVACGGNGLQVICVPR